MRFLSVPLWSASRALHSIREVRGLLEYRRIARVGGARRREQHALLVIGEMTLHARFPLAPRIWDDLCLLFWPGCSSSRCLVRAEDDASGRIRSAKEDQ